jgi:hypothetical protein
MSAPVGFYEVFFGQTNKAVTAKLLRYSALMVVLPIFTFYFMLHVVFKGDIDQLAWCGLGAVVMVNVVIVLYVRMAYSEDDNPPPEEEASLSVKAAGKTD